MKILVIDDDRDFAATLCELLAMFRHDATVAFTAGDAVVRLEKDEFDVALVDYKMPGMTGSQVIARCASCAARTKFVIMSGFHVEQLQKSINAEAVSAWLQKPVRVEKLKDILSLLGPELP